MKHEILFVDDDRFFARPYVKQLERLFTVHYVDCAGDVFSFLLSHSNIKLLLLDIMLPTPEGIASTATADGVDTGLWLLRELKHFLGKQRLPVVVLTNRDPGVVREAINRVNLPPGLVLICPKARTPALELPKRVQEQIDRWTLAAATV